MCGIAGQFFHNKALPDVKVLNGMADAMQYRGPDDVGIYSAEHIGFVHRRLSIRDLTFAGHCPMGSDGGSVQIVFNGEIYNWRDLRSELEVQGVVFRSDSDTEVILHGYQVWGKELIPRLRGMFAFAIWDSGLQRLLLARDRLGEKPLFYMVTSDGLVFASTIEALKPLLVKRDIDPVAIACYLSYNFIPASHTVWDGIKVLPPAHFFVIEPGKALQLTRYWDFPRCPPSRRSLSVCDLGVAAAIEDIVWR